MKSRMTIVAMFCVLAVLAQAASYTAGLSQCVTLDYFTGGANYGSGTLYSYNVYTVWRGPALQFDLSGVPALGVGEYVTNAKVHISNLYNSYNTAPFEGLAKIDTAWTPSVANTMLPLTWLNWGGSGFTGVDTITQYTTMSGTFDMHNFSDAALNTLVQNWLTGATPNYGLGLLSAYVGGTQEYLAGIGNPGVYAPTLTFDVVPEPATMMLLGLGGLAVLRRKK